MRTAAREEGLDRVLAKAEESFRVLVPHCSWLGWQASGLDLSHRFSLLALESVRDSFSSLVSTAPCIICFRESVAAEMPTAC